MKPYTFTRDLDGAPAGSTAALTTEEAAPLLRSGAIVEAASAVDAPYAPTIAPSDATPLTVQASEPAAPATPSVITTKRRSKA